MQTTNIKNFDTIVGLKTEWSNIYNSNKSLSVFQSYEWSLAMEHKMAAISNRFVNYIRENWKIKYYYFDYGDNNIIIAPLIISNKNKEITIFGQQDETDYLSFIFMDIIDINYIVSSIKYLRDKYKGYTFLFDRINESNIKMLEALKQIDNKYETKICVKIPVVADLLSVVKSDPRRYAKQGYKRLTDDGFKYCCDIHYDHITPSLNRVLYSHFLERSVHKYNFSTSKKIKSGILQLFYQLLGNRDIFKYYCALKDKLYLFECHINGHIAAYMIGAIKDDVMYILRISIDDNYAIYRPGILLIVDSINNMNSMNKDIKFLDFSRGDESYKINYGGQIHNNFCFAVKSN